MPPRLRAEGPHPTIMVGIFILPVPITGNFGSLMEVVGTPCPWLHLLKIGGPTLQAEEMYPIEPVFLGTVL